MWALVEAHWELTEEVLVLFSLQSHPCSSTMHKLQLKLCLIFMLLSTKPCGWAENCFHLCKLDGRLLILFSWPPPKYTTTWVWIGNLRSVSFCRNWSLDLKVVRDKSLMDLNCVIWGFAIPEEEWGETYPFPVIKSRRMFSHVYFSSSNPNYSTTMVLKKLGGIGGILRWKHWKLYVSANVRVP